MLVITTWHQTNQKCTSIKCVNAVLILHSLMSTDRDVVKERKGKDTHTLFEWLV